jgi:hypothetical protein
VKKSINWPEKIKKSGTVLLIISFGLFLISCGTESSTSESSTTESSAYSDNGTTFKVTVSSYKYYIDGSMQTSLTLKQGYTYYFDATDSTTDNHPLFIGTTSAGGSYTYEYTSGVTKSRTTTETLTFIVPSDAPSTLYYNCGSHTLMGGIINIM